MKSGFLTTIITVVLGIGVGSVARAVLTTNSWADGSSKWETPGNWSAGAPSITNAANLITNASTKIVTVDATTVASNGLNNCMTISNLLISAPVGTVNTLQLANAGPATPLRILNGLTLTSGGAISITNSILQVDGLSGGGFTVDGNALLLDGSIINTNAAAHVGLAGQGAMTVSNGAWLASSIVVGQNAGSRGTFTCAGGTNTAGQLNLGSFAGATGTVWMTGGNLTVSPQPTQIGVFGVGQMTVSNGTFVAGSLNIPGTVGSGAQGTLTIAGGEVSVSDLTMNDPPNGRVVLSSGTLTAVSTFIANGQVFNVGGGNALATLNLGAGSHLFNNGLTIGPTLGSTGAVWTTGFNVVASAVLTYVGQSGVGRMTILDGVVRSSTLIAGGNASSVGTLTVAGGTNLISALLDVGDALGATGAVWVTSGQLVVTNNTILVGNAGVGQMTVSNGSVLAQFLDVGALTGSRGTLTVAGGVTTVSSTFAVGLNASATGAVWMTGGQLVATNGVTFVGSNGVGQMTISNATVLTRDTIVASSAGSRGTITLAPGSTASVSSNLVLGNFACTSTGIVNIVGGELDITNALTNAVLEVRSGTVILNSGTLVVDRFVMTNACSHFVRTGGTLIYGSAVLDPNRDDDGDGIPNGYEQAHGLDPLNPVDANLDNDGDGMSNLQEYLAGTDPNDPNSAFRITSVLRTNTDILISWTMGPGKTNALQVTAGAGDGSYQTNNFTDLFTVTNTTGTITNYTDAGAATNGPFRYYRVRLVP